MDMDQYFGSVRELASAPRPSSALAVWQWRFTCAPNNVLPVFLYFCYFFKLRLPFNKTSTINCTYRVYFAGIYTQLQRDFNQTSFFFNLFRSQSLSSEFRLASYDLMSLACKRIIFWKESCSAFLARSVVLSSFDSKVFILCTITWFCFWSWRSLSFVLFSFCCSFEWSSLCNSLHGQLVRLLRKL